MNLIGNKYLGFLPAKDERNKGFAVQARPLEAVPISYKYWVTGLPLDQGETPQCAAYSGEKYLTSGPVRNKFYLTPQGVYDEAQSIDEWAGTPHDGTSINAIMKVFQKHGYVSEYRWAFDVQTALSYVLTTGPLIFGTNWYLKMFEPDSNGFLKIDGPNMGGHAYLVYGANRLKKCPDGSIGAFRMINSWGRAWAQNGAAWIPFTMAQRLMDEYGEIAMAKEIKVS